MGTLSLNCSFILYLVLYVPQIAHNHSKQHLHELSISMHVLLFSAYVLDLVYGYSTHLPWQYRAVSLVGMGLLTTQHLQITFYQSINRLISFLFLALIATALLYFFSVGQFIISETMASSLGFISRILFTVCFLPQVLKNQVTHSNQALNRYFIILNMTVAILDIISAWCLNWGWPNKIGPPIILILLLLLLRQTTAGKYKQKPPPLQNQLRVLQESHGVYGEC